MDWDTENVFPRDRTGRDSEVRNTIRTGKVIEQVPDPTGIFVRVQWLDRDMLISQPLPVEFQCASGSKKAFFPKIGSDVDVMMFPNGDEDGIVIGCHYTTSNPPPIQPDPTRAVGDWFNLDHTLYNDGTIIEYDENTSTYKIDAKGPINITTLNDVTINGINIKVTGSGEITLTAPNIKLVGNTSIEGTLAVTEDITSEQNIRATVFLYDQRGVNHN